MHENEGQPRWRIVTQIVCAVLGTVVTMKLAIQGGWSATPAPFLANQQPREIQALVWAKLAGLMIHLIETLPLVALMWLGAYGYGRLIVRDGRDIALIRTLVGMAVMLQLNWLLAWAGGLNGVTAWVLIAAGIVIAALPLIRWLQREEATPPVAPKVPWVVLAGAPALGLLLVACFCPPSSLWKVEAWGYDVVSYHLQLPREWLAAGRMSGLHHNVYSYLPSLVETAYMLLGAVKGSMPAGIFAAQLLHVSAAIAAATAIGAMVARRAGAMAGVVAGIVFLSVPWTVITATLAYNEMFAIAFGAAALLAVFDNVMDWKQRALVVGLALGGSILSKLTIGGMFAIPAGLIMLVGTGEVRGSFKMAVSAALVSIVTLAPWMARNGLDTGNPIFPFATTLLGRGHWTQEVADRWDKAHHVDMKTPERFGSIAEHWLLNAGYGAVLGRDREHETAGEESRNIARFDTAGGVPLLWIAALVGAVLCFREASTRWLAGLMLMMILVQLLLWLYATHLQSRFLIPTLLPGCVLIGAGLGRFRFGVPVVAALAIALTLAGFNELQRQTAVIGTPQHGMQHVPVREIVNVSQAPESYLINRLAPDSHTLVIADSTQLLFLRNRVSYNTAFDVNPFGELTRRAGREPQAIAQAMRDAGYTHVWINFGELDRLHKTYGFDRDVTQELVGTMINNGWQILWTDQRVNALFAVTHSL